MRIIGGRFQKRELFSPKGDATRPTSSLLREALFNILQSSIEEATFLDLYAGSGAVGLEALSRGATKVIFVEKNRLALEALKKNSALLKVEDEIQILYGDVFSNLKKIRGIDILFADPPYLEDLKQDFVGALLTSLDQSDLLNPGARCFFEVHKKKALFSEPLNTLTFVNTRVFGDSQLISYLKTKS